MASGRVIFVSRNYGMLVVEHDQGFSVVELLESKGDIEREDRLKADWSTLGGETLYKGGEPYDAYFQNCFGNPAAAIRMARNMGGG